MAVGVCGSHILCEASRHGLGTRIHGIPSPTPTHVSKSQHGCQVPTSEPQETIKIWFTCIEVGYSLFYGKIIVVLVLRVGSSSFLLDSTLST